MKKRLSGMMILLIGVMLVFTFTGCNNGTTDNEHQHSFKTAWSYNTTQHWVECSCGEKTNVASHAYSEGSNLCTFCAYNKITETHEHVYSTVLSSNSTQHWNECGCGEKANAADHTYSGDTCIVCGYNKSTGSGPRTLIIANISDEQMAQSYNGGFFAIFPVGISKDNAKADFESLSSGTGSISHAVASQNTHNIDSPTGTTAPYVAIVPLYKSDNTNTRWTGSGTFDCYVFVSDESKGYLYKFPNVSFTSTATLVSAANVILLETVDIPRAAGFHGTVSLTNVPPSPAEVFIQVSGVTTTGSKSWQNDSHGGNRVKLTGSNTNLPWTIPLADLKWMGGGSGEFFPADVSFMLTVLPQGHNNFSGAYPKALNSTPKRYNSQEEAVSGNIDFGTVDLTRPPSTPGNGDSDDGDVSGKGDSGKTK